MYSKCIVPNHYLRHRHPKKIDVLIILEYTKSYLLILLYYHPILIKNDGGWLIC